MLIDFLIQYSVCSSDNLPIREIKLTLAFIYKYIHLSHAIIYIDFIQIALICLSGKIITMKNGREHNLDQSECVTNIRLMRQIKLIYLKVWHIANGVNRQFGWFLTAFLIEVVIIVTHSFYWPIANMKMLNGNTYMILCKPNFIENNIETE